LLKTKKIKKEDKKEQKLRKKSPRSVNKNNKNPFLLKISGQSKSLFPFYYKICFAAL
jgi:hypothetical protein